MEESRAWIPADSPEFQLSRSSHCIFIAGGQSHVKRASEHMLAVFGYTKCRSCEHRICLGCTITREHKRLIRADGFHNAGKKIENADVEDDPFARMVVAQELGQLGQGLLHWSRVISNRGRQRSRPYARPPNEVAAAEWAE